VIRLALRQTLFLVRETLAQLRFIARNARSPSHLPDAAALLHLTGSGHAAILGASLAIQGRSSVAVTAHADSLQPQDGVSG